MSGAFGVRRRTRSCDALRVLARRTSRLWRMAGLAACTAGGLAVGLLGDVAAGDVRLSWGDVWGAVVLSPVVVPIGGAWVAEGALRWVFGVAGVLFWPGYALLAWRWLRGGAGWLAAAAPLWTALGFYRVLHRLAVVMSV